MVFLHAGLSAFEFYIFISFFKSIFFLREEFSKKSMYYLLLSVCCLGRTVYILFIWRFFRTSPYLFIISTLAFLILISFLFNAKNKERIFYSCILLLFDDGSEIFVGFFLANFMNHLLPLVKTVDSDNIFGIVCSKIVFLFVVRIASLFYRKEKKMIPLAYWLVLFFVPAVSIFELYAVVLCYAEIASTDLHKPLQVIPGIIIINILTFVIYDIVSIQYEKIMQKEREVNDLENSQKRYNSVVRHGLELASIAHDAGKHLEAIGGLIRDKDFDSCLKYINELGIMYDEVIAHERILPHNQALSIVISSKFREAAAKGIEINRNIAITHKISASDTDLCVIFGNALDNAILACEEFNGDKKIFLDIQNVYNRIIIKIQNTSNPVKIEADGLCLSTKKDAIRHGFGLKNIRSIVKSYDGNMLLHYKNGYFTLSIILFV